MTTLEKLTGATVYLHPQTAFTTPKISIGCVAVAGITLLVVGILAMTNSMIVLAGAYAMVGLGGATLFGGIAALIVLGVKHQRAIKSLLNYVERQVSLTVEREWWAQIFNYLEPMPETPIDQIKYFTDAEDYEQLFYTVIVRTGDAKSIHIYSDENEQDMKILLLQRQEYKFRYWKMRLQ